MLDGLLSQVCNLVPRRLLAEPCRIEAINASCPCSIVTSGVSSQQLRIRDDTDAPQIEPVSIPHNADVRISLSRRMLDSVVVSECELHRVVQFRSEVHSALGSKRLKERGCASTVLGIVAIGLAHKVVQHAEGQYERAV